MITDEHLLTIRKFIASKAKEAAGSMFEVFPSGLDFTGKEAFWSNTGANKITQKDLETSLVNGIWVEWLNWSDASTNPNVEDAGENDSPLITRIYQLTIFCEANNARLDENSADVFDKRLLSVDVRLESVINALVVEFRGISVITDLPAGEFVIRESNSIYMTEYVERDAVCDFIPNKRGRQAKLICPIKLQLEEC